MNNVVPLNLKGLDRPNKYKQTTTILKQMSEQQDLALLQEMHLFAVEDRRGRGEVYVSQRG